jgi:hypothetical protein
MPKTRGKGFWRRCRSRSGAQGRKKEPPHSMSNEVAGCSTNLFQKAPRRLAGTWCVIRNAARLALGYFDFAPEGLRCCSHAAASVPDANSSSIKPRSLSSTRITSVFACRYSLRNVVGRELLIQRGCQAT